MRNSMYDISNLLQLPGQQNNQLPRQQQAYNSFHDPLVMSGYGIAAGQPINQAVAQATKFQNDQLQAQRQQQEFDMKAREEAKRELFAQQISQLGITDPLDVSGNIAKAVQAGAPFTAAISFANTLAHNSIENTKAKSPTTSPTNLALLKAELDQELEIGKETRKANAKILEESRVEEKSARQSLGTLDRFDELSSLVKTGGNEPWKQKLAKHGPDALGNYIGITQQNVADFEQLKTESDKLKVEASSAIKGQGSVSNEERELVGNTVTSESKGNKANQNNSTIIRATSLRTIERIKAQREWIKIHGSTQGFDEKWDNYIDHNHVLSKDKEGNLILNKKNISNWKAKLFGEEEEYVETYEPGLHTPQISQLSDESRERRKAEIDAEIAQLGG